MLLLLVGLVLELTLEMASQEWKGTITLSKGGIAYNNVSYLKHNENRVEDM